MSKKEFLGIDVGGSGIKGAIVDVSRGELVTERLRIPTPSPSTPKAVAKTFTKMVKEFGWKKDIGCGFPSVIINGTTLTAANIDEKWIGVAAEELLCKACGCPVHLRNDADLAGLAAMKFGAGKGVMGSVLFITIGSGLGSALFINGQLVPNTELGHIYLKGHKIIGEKYAADSIRKKEALSWEEWALRFDKYLKHVNKIIRPELIILGGGGSKKFDEFAHFLTIKTKVVPAQLLNEAGIIGAALYAAEKSKR